MSGRLYRAAPSTGRRPGTARTTRHAQQRARADQLDAIRLERPLTGAEQAEADRLADRLYMRVNKTTVHELLHELERRGRISRLPRRERAIEVLAPVPVPCAPDGAPLFAVPVP